MQSQNDTNLDLELINEFLYLVSGLKFNPG